MLEHDAQVFGDWAKGVHFQGGWIEFGKDNHRLTVMNVNREGVEHVLGVDLVYFHHTYQSYVLVQYKRLDRDSEGRACYYPTSDNQLQKELSLMRQIQSTADATVGIPGTYRLHSGPCYLKLCPPVVLDPYSADLIKGMYIPLDYWDHLLNCDATLGC